MRLRSALLASCLASACGSDSGANAQHNAPATIMSPVPAPVPTAPVPPPPRRPMPPEVAAALRDARATESLLLAGRFDEAVANYRRAVAEAPTVEVAGVVSMRIVHLAMLSSILILRDRSADADSLLAEFLASPPEGARDRNLESLLELVDRRIYIASGRGDAEAVVALLRQRSALRPSDSPLACADPPFMPDVVAPMHRDPRVLAALRRFGCGDDIIEQIDRLAQEPIATAIPLPAPGRRRLPAPGRR